jgi:hypothetical protein
MFSSKFSPRVDGGYVAKVRRVGLLGLWGVGSDYVEAINTTIRCYEGITEANEMVRSLET